MFQFLPDALNCGQGALHDFARRYEFDPEQEQYLVHITTGTHVAQICLFLLTESRHFPGKLVQTSPPPRHQSDSSGSFQIIDLDLSRYDRIFMRFQDEQQEGRSFLKSGIETRSALFNTLIQRIEQVAIASSAPILLMGPTGAGKSHLARRIYELKKVRRQVEGPFVELNCATLRGDAAMSALFALAAEAAAAPEHGLAHGPLRGIVRWRDARPIGKRPQRVGACEQVGGEAADSWHVGAGTIDQELDEFAEIRSQLVLEALSIAVLLVLPHAAHQSLCDLETGLAEGPAAARPLDKRAEVSFQVARS